MINNKFESFLLNNEIAVAYFCSPDCYKCKFLGPQIESLFRENNIALVKVDISVNPNVAVLYDVLGLPTLIFFRNGREHLRLTATNVSIPEIQKACAKVSKSGQ